ncbi:peptidoglycan-binding protein [Streptomyces sp. GC420]|uniref:L,D-transpeptidase family protein n=1 Tax=Streptomyces sp. GC420 TaxID=2697568 RepID=UPI001414F389|nr:peptidoglycan-binding protein [Streptomyces sp. GC420]NBM16192.1 L,D-transpeptidase family protein [Streptomyces sp. GC420]
MRTYTLRRTLAAGLAAAAIAAGAVGCRTTEAGGEVTGSASPVRSSAPASPADGSDGSDDKPAASGKPSGKPSKGSPKSPGPDAAAKPKIMMAEGTESEQVRELQARLRQLGHFKRSPTAFYGSITSESVRAFQSGKGLTATGSVDETTWRTLTSATHRPTENELRPPTSLELDAPDARCMTGRVLCISKESRTLAWMIDGKVVSAMDVRFGSENTPTREGIFKVDFKSRDHVSTLYDTPMPYAMFFSRGRSLRWGRGQGRGNVPRPRRMRRAVGTGGTPALARPMTSRLTPYCVSGARNVTPRGRFLGNSRKSQVRGRCWGE